MLHKTEDTAIILTLSRVPGMGNVRVNRLLAFMCRAGWEMSRLRDVGNKDFLSKIIEWDSGIAALLCNCDGKLFEESHTCLEHAAQHDIYTIHVLEDVYPKLLKQYLDVATPPLLFVRGNNSLLHKVAGAVVGTRNPSKRGISAAHHAAEAIVQNKAVVVSGGAFGVDRAAHDAAVRAGGHTVVLLPQGVLSWSFPKHWSTAFKEGRVTLVSAYLPNASWQTHAAVSRNALISAMAQVVCVVEPRKQGGSILTLRHAIEQHKPVFVEPVSALPTGLHTQVQPLQDFPEALASLDLERMFAVRETKAVQIDLL
ncbi:MAG: DNA-processing protein DprA [Candidatus Hydrogenedentes bacterium]|nr:DNA-processing protein DprA [Candidatus Hydrogenedentota bacterium]